jgi:hypothetical protein
MAEQTEEVCCPEFDPAPWQAKDVEWQDKQFIKESIRTFFHIPNPLAVGKAMTKLQATAEVAGATLPPGEWLVLAHDPSPFRCDYYLAVSKEVPGAANARLSGQYIAQVFDGPYSAVPKWMKEMGALVAKQGKQAQDFFIFYTTCPKCAKKYGHNYSVVFAKVG